MTSTVLKVKLWLSNSKNKHNIILSIGNDKVTQEAVQSLYEKHPDNSVIVTLDEQGRSNQHFGFRCHGQ
jgi:hypothetical protein